MIKVIIFDFDGVLINEYQKHYELSKKGIKNLTEEEFKQLFEGNIHTEREKLKERHTEFDIKSNFDKYKESIVIEKKIRNMLIKLSKKYILGIISSAKENGINKVLKNSGLEKIVSFVYGYETQAIKIEKFKRVLKEFHLKKQECIFVTDTVGDIEEARKSSIESIAVDFGYHKRKRLEKARPLKIISSFAEIEKVLKS
jgi:phosphoglycolate phosphatase